jgi:hypothetical protein
VAWEPPLQVWEALNSSHIHFDTYGVETLLHELLLKSPHRCAAQQRWWSSWQRAMPRRAAAPTSRLGLRLPTQQHPHNPCPPLRWRRTFDPEEADFFYVPIYSSCFAHPIYGFHDAPWWYAPLGG